MIDIKDVQLEERNVYSATKWGIAVLLYSLILNIFLNVNTSILTNPLNVLDYGLLAFTGILYLSTWVIRIIVAVYVYRIAKKLNRPAATWAIFGFIFPPITLIVLGFQDYKIDDKNIKKIVEDIRLDLRAEFVNIKATQDLSAEEIDKKEIELKEKYAIVLKEKVVEYLATQPKSTMEKDRVQFQFENEDDSPKSGTGNDWMNEVDRCPACGAKLNGNSNICPDCGLNIQ